MVYNLQKLYGVHPALWYGVGLLAIKSKYDWQITSGKRLTDQQAALYAQGRTLPGPIVTDAPPGTSAHEFGLAIDVAPVIKGDTSEAYAERDRILGATGLFDPTIKISSGTDWPHVQVKDWKGKKGWANTAIAVGAIASLVVLVGVFS